MVWARTDRNLSYMGPRRVHTDPKGRFPTWQVDPWRWVEKRNKFGCRVRGVLYGAPPGKRVPCWGDRHAKAKHWYCREVTWGMEVRQRERAGFTYTEMLECASGLVRHWGGPCDLPTGTEEECIQFDLEVLMAFQAWMREKTVEMNVYNRPGLTPAQKMEYHARKRVENLVMHGICPLCGDRLPCEECGVPKYYGDGKGGIRPGGPTRDS